MELNKPFYISSRLMPALKIDDGEINLEYSKRPGHESRTRYHYVIEINGKEHSADDLQSGNQGGNILYGFTALLDYLASAGDSYRYNGMKCKEDTSSDLFPDWICEWAYQHSDELTMLRFELEERPELIEE